MFENLGGKSTIERYFLIGIMRDGIPFNFSIINFYLTITVFILIGLL
jgi:hypothetical protein